MKVFCSSIKKIFKPTSFVAVPDDVNLNGFFVVDDSGIYTVSSNAIVRFQESEPPTVYFKDHPDLQLLKKDENYQSVDILEQKIYLATITDLLEFDLKKGSRQILLSPKLENKNRVVSNISRIGGAIADIKLGNVQIIFDRKVEGDIKQQVVSFDPDERVFTLISSREQRLFHIMPECGSRRMGNLVLNKGSDVLSASVIGDERGEWLRCKWNRNDFRRNRKTTLGKNGFINVNPGLYYFERPVSSGVSVLNKFRIRTWNKINSAKDEACHPDKGLLLLCDLEIFSLPIMHVENADRLRGLLCIPE